MSGRWLTVREAAPLLGLGLGSVYALCAAGKLEHLRVGLRQGKLLIPEESIRSYLASCVVAAPASQPAPEPPQATRRPRHRQPAQPGRYQSWREVMERRAGRR